MATSRDFTRSKREELKDTALSIFSKVDLDRFFDGETRRFALEIFDTATKNIEKREKEDLGLPRKIKVTKLINGYEEIMDRDLFEKMAKNATIGEIAFRSKWKVEELTTEEEAPDQLKVREANT